jgi:hypothetical protein
MTRSIVNGGYINYTDKWQNCTNEKNNHSTTRNYTIQEKIVEEEKIGIEIDRIIFET